MNENEKMVQRDLGRLEAEISSLKGEVSVIKKDLKEVLEFVHETKGGKKWMFGLLTILMSLSATLSGAMTYFFSK